jgi:hypothetical protein
LSKCPWISDLPHAQIMISLRQSWYLIPFAKDYLGMGVWLVSSNMMERRSLRKKFITVK